MSIIQKLDIQAPTKNSKYSKLILTAYSTKLLDFVQSILQSKGIKFYRLDGSTKPEIRQKLVDKFNDSKNPICVFLLGAKAGGAGLNMVGANRMIMMDIDWNPSNEKQVMGRIYRPGKKFLV